jgi:hypothetical protein
MMQGRREGRTGRRPVAARDGTSGDLSTLSVEELQRARVEQDRRLTPLFRRWPALSARELGELEVVYEERQRLARYLGWLRLRRRSSRGRET